MAANNIYIQVDLNSQNAQQNVNALNQSIANTGTAAEKSSKQATTAMSSVNISVQQTTHAFSELTTALAGLGIARMVTSFVQIGSELNRAQTMMTAFTGSAEEASKVFEQIRGIAAQSPFRFKDLEETTRLLLGFGMSAKEVPQTIKIVTDQVAAMGGSIENVNAIVRIFGRVMEKDFVSAMDLLRLLPQQAIPIMDALKKAMTPAGQPLIPTADVQKALKEGALDPAKTITVILGAMQEKTRGAAALINDAAKALKNFGDMADYLRQQLAGPSGFGPALNKLAGEIGAILAPLAGVVEELMKLPEPTKELIVNVAAGVTAVGAFAGAWQLFTTISGPAIKAIVGLGSAIAKALVVVLTNPELLAAMATVTAFVAGFVLLYPEQAKKLEKAAEDWVGSLWKKLQDKIGALAKEGQGLVAKLLGLDDKKVDVKNPVMEAKLEELQKQVQEWAASASQTLLGALSSPADAVAIKYTELFAKLNEKIKEQFITDEHANELRAQLSLARDMETDAKIFEKRKQDIAEQYKLEGEAAKGSYEAQIAYIEALDAQDLRGKVAGIDRITALRAEAAQNAARLEKVQLEDVYNLQVQYLSRYRKEFEAAGIDVDAAILARQQEMLDKEKVIHQKAVDEEQKYRLEGWKKANDAIIEEQKRVYDAFKSEFDEIFDAITDKSKSLGQALGDVFKKLALGEVRNIFSSQAAAAATELAGYGRPTEQVTRGGGILSTLLQRGMPPRPPGPPPEAYTPVAGAANVTYEAQGSANRFAVGVDAYNDATIRFALAVGQFAGTAGTAGARQGSADREEADSADVFAAASQATGVNQTLLRSVARVESAMDPGAISPKGAMGLMQLMPKTAADLGVTNPFNAAQNVMGGAQYLGQLLERYGGSVPMALAAYNMGPAAFDRAMVQGRPLPQETQNYVRHVQALMTQGAIQEGGGFAQASREFPLPAGYSVQGGQLSYETPSPGWRAATPTELAQGGTESPGWRDATPTELAQVQQAGTLAQVAAVLGKSVGGTGGGGGTQQANLLNVGRLASLFGVSGGFSPARILTSQGAGALYGMAGMALLSKGLQQRNTLASSLGGGAAGLGYVLSNPQLMAKMSEHAGGVGLGLGAGVATGVGLGVFASGFQRGGGAGLAMDIGGGALAGAGIGTMIAPGLGTAIGAAVGAGVGAITGIVRLFVHTEQERIRSQIKQVYGIDISNRQILTQIQQIVDQTYGGSVSIGIRSQEVQNIVRLYALSTGQAAGLPRPMYAATIAQSTQGLQLQPVYEGGVQVKNPYTGPTTYQYQTAVVSAQGLMAGTSLGVPGASGLISQQWQQLTLQTIQGNPSAIAMANASAASAGDSRLTTTRAMQEPLTALS